MADLWSWVQTPEFLVLVGFHVFIVAMLALDLGVFQRHAHAVGMKEAAAWSVVWIVLALLFALGIWLFWDGWHPGGEPGQGSVKAIEFVTGYIIEKSLSVDNLFVFLVIFKYFAVPPQLQHRVLYWGILGALIMRAAMILAGAALLNKFHWMIYVFGGILLYTAYKMLRTDEEEIDPGRNILLRIARRSLPVVNEYESGAFWVKRDVPVEPPPAPREAGGGNGPAGPEPPRSERPPVTTVSRWHATPLPLVLLVVESTDVVFAVDSIPAIFAITKDTFIVYTSNIFAILGLRALFFLLAGFLGMFRYLSTGLALVLAFVGLKMILEEQFSPYLARVGIDKNGLILISLVVVAGILAVSVAASLLAGRQEPPDHPPVVLDPDAAPTSASEPLPKS